MVSMKASHFLEHCTTCYIKMLKNIPPISMSLFAVSMMIRGTMVLDLDKDNNDDYEKLMHAPCAVCSDSNF